MLGGSAGALVSGALSRGADGVSVGGCSVGGTSGVNRYQARLDTNAIAQGNFRMGPTAGTRMMGANQAMQLESSFLQALQEADRAMVEGNLLLLKRGERTLLRFERVTAG